MNVIAYCSKCNGHREHKFKITGVNHNWKKCKTCGKETTQ